MACFISAAGEMLLPTFLDKHVNQTWAKPLAELKGEYNDPKNIFWLDCKQHDFLNHAKMIFLYVYVPKSHYVD